jgi:hypothetical protein
MSLANDVVSVPARYIAGTVQLVNKLRAAGYLNVISCDKLAFASGNRAERITIVGEELPSTNYDTYVQVGDEYHQITFTSGVPATFRKFVRIEGNAWGEALIVPQSAAVVRTAAKKEIEVNGSNSGTGDYRAFYGKINLTGAGGSGDAVRGYAVTTAAATACRGAHLTAEVGAAGSVTGLIAGATLQCTTVSGLTLAGTGSYYAANLVADLGSALGSVTDAAFIGCSDLQSNKMPYFASIDSSATGCVVSTNPATAAGGIKVKVAGAVRYIALYSGSGA